tara:strand:- start:1148 stop:1951 length:804 start_codon:yes stop_codon:yes gene_type:complete
MSNSNIEKAQEWFEKLRENLINKIEDIESAKFKISEWKHREEGGGKMSKIKGAIIEKGGVNVSSVAGRFTKNFSTNIPGTEKNNSYRATGISVVLHPYSPHIPSMHFNTRYLETEKIWFGGGMDMTPCMPFTEENDYHIKLKKICDQHDQRYYPKFKKWCDEYFYLPHRSEPRGVGGIFFDNLNNDWNKDFNFIKDVGLFFTDYVIYILEKYKDKSWNNEQKEIQLIKRSRYAEFNLLHDRGTRFGLETGGNIDAILMSMPPYAKWE